MKKIYLKQLLAAILLLCSTVVSAETYSGTCGENVNWSLANGVLTISGTGPMKNYSYASTPWYEYRKDITTVVIENGITSIGDYTFNYCGALTSVTIPGSVTSIGEYAFYYCYRLTSIEIPGSVTSIGEDAFRGCSGLTSVTIPNSVTSIGDAAFAGCTGLTSIVVDEENSVYDSREGCNAIIETATNTLITGCKNTIIPNSVTVINDYAFAGYTSLTSITIPNSVTSIGDYAFDNCSGLTSVTIPNSVTSIGARAFGGCWRLTSITIPNSVTSIGNLAFEWCEALTSVTIPNSVTSIGQGAFRDCTGLTSITIPNSVTSIGSEAFCDCTGLTEITIPNSVTSINNRTFAGCTGLTSVTIGKSVTDINVTTFEGCSGLTDIYFASNTTIEGNAIPSGATCHLTITDSDAAYFHTANANTYADVSYTRTISEGKYGTIMLPFAPDEASLQNYAFYTLKEAGDGYIRFEEVTAPVANTPYLYTLREGGENAAITGGETTIAADINNCNVNGWEFIGSFNNNTIDCTDGNYYAYSAARNEINRITKTLTVRPYRAFLMSTAAQNSNLRVFIGGTTGVTEISPDDIEGFDGGAVYDLYGRPVNEPAKGGVYIINGKKVVL